MRVVTDQLQFPEGPVWLKDGSLLAVEIRRKTLTRIWPDGRVQIVAHLGGGPNGAAMGPDGHCYVVNNGGFTFSQRADGTWVNSGVPADYVTGRVERVNLATGAFERLYDKVRVGTEDIQIVVTSINILRQSGGNLSETFDTVATTIRERKKVQGRIASLTAQGVAQGVIIVFMPFVLGFILWMMDPVLISRLWTTWLGWVLIFAMLTLQTIGAWMIRKIVKVQV